jgi:hypothetical protein
VRIRRHAWGSALLVAALAAGFPGGSAASAVAGAGEVADGELPFVAKVTFGDARGCTGVLVSPRWILTAKACFTDGSAPVAAGAPARPTTVLLGRADLTGTSGHRLLVQHVLPHPDRNVALAELSAPVKDIAPVGLDGAAARVGESLRIAGYGRTATAWVPDRLHAGTFTVESADAASFTVTASGGATLCKGDAGGPAFREVSGRVELVGVHDRSWQKNCIGETETRDGAVETRTDDLADWIRAGAAVQPQGLREPVIGEFTRDGRPDMVAVDAAGLQWLYPGTATPNVWADRIQIGSGWSGYRDFAIGRVNRDEFDDLVTIESATQKLWMYPGTAAGGRFGARVDIGSGWGAFRDVTIGKVNRDQYDDLLVVRNTDHKLFLYTGNAAGGHFNPAVEYGAGWNCCAQLMLGRFTADDYDDLVTVDQGTGRLRIYRGTSHGQQFEPGADAGAGAAWKSAAHLIPGRFDGTGLDGLLAVDAATGQTWLHPRTADGGWGARIAPPGRAWAPQPYELTRTVTGEFTRDAHTDLIGVDAAGELWLHPGTAARTFGPRTQIGTGWSGYRDFAIGRVNRDEFDDLVTIESATQKLWMYPGTAAGGRFGARVDIGSGWGAFRDVTIGKVNRDQYDDLLVVRNTDHKLFLYTGNATGGHFDPAVQYGAGWNCCAQLTLGRFTADAHDDLLTADQGTGKLRIYPSTEAGEQFGLPLAPAAGEMWKNRTELFAVQFAAGEHDGLLSRDPSGALVLNPATAAGTPDWADPIRFGPRD